MCAFPRDAIYARRSSDRGIQIATELVESASAKEPGRPVFNRLMEQVPPGKVNGILVWRPRGSPMTPLPL